MDHELIYAKTAAGERAMLERTRTMARNVRMVLILVDSQSSVGDLCLKTGNPQLIESALRELEKGGFIEPRRQQDTLWNEEKKLAQQIRAAVGARKSGTGHSAAGVAPDALRSLTPSLLASAPPAAASENGSGSGARAATAISSVPMTSIAGRIKGIFSRPQATAGQAASAATASTAMAEWGGSAAGRHPAGDEALSALLSAAPAMARARRRRSPLGVPAIAALSLLALLMTLLLTAWLFPYARYLPEVEAALSRACGIPVKASTLRFELMPRPALRLGDVRLGGGKDEIRFAELRLEPAISTLFAARKTYRTVMLSGVTLSAAALGAMPGIVSALAAPSAAVLVERIGFERAVLSLGGLSFPEMNGESRVSADGLSASLLLTSPDHSLSVSATPQREGVVLAIEASGWRPAPDSPFLFDSLNVAASYKDGMVAITRLELRIFDGLIEGQAVLSAGQEQGASGELTFQRLNASRLGNAAGLAERFSGEIAGRLSFSARAATWASLTSAINAEGEFSVQRGSVRGIDLIEAARRVSGAAVQGGETRFESLEAKLGVTPAGYRISDLLMNSGLMQAAGFVDVGEASKLNGKMELRMRGSANQTRVRLAIGGTLQTPTVQISRND